MRKNPILIAVLLMAAASAVASAQTNAPALNAAPTAVTTPSGHDARIVNPSGNKAENPKINPSAAGMQRGWSGYGSSAMAPHRSRQSHSDRHSAAKSENANTSPLKALETGKRR